MSGKSRIELFNRYLKKELSQQQLTELKELLKTPEGRYEFNRFISETGVIIQNSLQMPAVEAEDAVISELVKKSEEKLIKSLRGNKPKVKKSSSKGNAVRRKSFQVLFLAFLGVGAALTLFIMMNGGQEKSSLTSPLVKSVARVTGVDGRSNTAIGKWLKPGEVILEEGELEITFDSGAVIFLQGNSSLNLESDKRAFLNYGKISARVPEEAIGFIINTPQGTVVDLGTEFAVNVEKDKAMEVHVLEGEVEAGSVQGNEPKLLKKDESLRIESGGIIASDTKFDQSYFSRVPQSDSSINYNYIYWSFDKAVDRVVLDEGNGGMGGRYDLTIPFSSEYLSSGKSGNSLYLSGKGEYAQSSFQGIGAANARTVAFWVKVPPDSSGKEAYAIVSWGKVAPSQKWQVGYNPNPKNGVVGAVRTEFSLGYVIGTTDLRDGRWHHIVSMFIGGKRPNVATHVRHYVDGKLEGVSGFQPRDINTNITDPDTQPVYLGKYINHDHWYFRGKIDEFFIFDGALTPYQISLLRKNQFK